MQYYSAKKKKNTFDSVLMRRMILEPIIQSEVNKKEKDKYHVLTHIYGIWKDGTHDPTCRAAKETAVKNRLLNSVGEGEWDDLREQCCNVYVTIYKRDSQFEFDV